MLLQLIAQANAVVENYSGGVLPKLGLTYADLKQANEQIVLMSMPPFGASGPWAEFRAYGSTVEHSSGLPHLHGNPGDPPTMLHVAYGDAVGGVTGAGALMLALFHQARTGSGQFVDLSQAEGLFPLASQGILQYSATGKAPAQTGNAHAEYAPHGVYPCLGEEEWILIQVTDESQWQAFKGWLQCGAEFDSLTYRLKQREELDALIAGKTQNLDGRALTQTLQNLGVPAMVAMTLEQVLEDPHLQAREYWQWLDRPYVGSQPNPSAPYRDADGPLAISAPTATLGQHNHQVLRDSLGVSEQELAELEELGVIGTRPRMPR